MMNHVSLLGKVTAAGVKLTYSERGTPECRWTLMLEETGPEGQSFKTFIPCHSFGKSAEAIAEQIDPGDWVLISDGKLKVRQWTNQAGEKERRLEVLTWAVQVIALSHPAESGTPAGN
jgi:single-stranded DNA-binding protein